MNMVNRYLEYDSFSSYDVTNRQEAISAIDKVISENPGKVLTILTGKGGLQYLREAGEESGVEIIHEYKYKEGVYVTFYPVLDDVKEALYPKHPHSSLPLSSYNFLILSGHNLYEAIIATNERPKVTAKPVSHVVTYCVSRSELLRAANFESLRFASVINGEGDVLHIPTITGDKVRFSAPLDYKKVTLSLEGTPQKGSPSKAVIDVYLDSGEVYTISPT